MEEDFSSEAFAKLNTYEKINKVCRLLKKLEIFFDEVTFWNYNKRTGTLRLRVYSKDESIFVTVSDINLMITRLKKWRQHV